MAHETEIKVEVADADEVSRRLEALGAVGTTPRTFEDNRLFDLPGLPLARSGRLLRVREYGGRATITAKGPADGPSSPFKVRHEIETGVEDGAAAAAILSLVGFEPVWRYQKYRREYRFVDALVVVDEIPHGVFVEIEGEPDAIEEVARRLGFERAAWRTETYREVHERRCREAGIPCGDMLFVKGGTW